MMPALLSCTTSGPLTPPPTLFSLQQPHPPLLATTSPPSPCNNALPYPPFPFPPTEKDSPIKPSVVAQENIDFETLRAEDLEYNFEKKGLSNLRRRMFWAIADYQGEATRSVGKAQGCEMCVET